MHCGRHVKKHRRTLSEQSGLQFPVARVRRYLKRSLYKRRVSAAACVFLTAIMEYLTAEVLEVAGKVILYKKRDRITPRHILLSVQRDAELNELFKSVTIPEGGIIPKLNDSHCSYTLSYWKTS